MPSNTVNHICIAPQPARVGGPASFIERVSAALAQRGVQVSPDLDSEACDAILLVGGSRRLVALRRAQREGRPIVQRLDGINWLHRVRFTGPRHWLKAQMSNLVLAYTRDRLANHVIYQSAFVRNWWQREYGEGPPGRVIHNGADLAHFTPAGPGSPPEDRIRILMVEGSLGGGYEIGLEHGLALAGRLAQVQEQPVELAVAGAVSPKLRKKAAAASGAAIEWLGLLTQEELPEQYRRAHFLFSGDINAACPNSVVEALACGLPVVAFNTGALAELVDGEAGRLAAYGGDPWRLEPADIAALAEAAQTVLDDLPRYRSGARARAEAAFSLNIMVEQYLEVLRG